MRRLRRLVLLAFFGSGCSPRDEPPVLLVERLPEARFASGVTWRWQPVAAEIAANPPRMLWQDHVLAADQDATAEIELPAAPYVFAMDCTFDVGTAARAGGSLERMELALAASPAELGLAHNARQIQVPGHPATGSGEIRHFLAFNTAPGERFGRVSLRTRAAVVVRRCSVGLVRDADHLRELGGFRGFRVNPTVYPWRKYLELDAELKHSLLFPGAAEVGFRMRIPGDAVFETHYAAVGANSFRGAARFVAEFLAEGEDAPRPVLEAALPAADVGRWRLLSRPLDDLAGRNGVLVLRTEVAAGERPLLAWGTPTLFRRSGRRPNLLVITIDSLNAARMTGAPGARDTTPFLASLARQGIHFPSLVTHYTITHLSLLSMLYSREDAAPLLNRGPEGQTEAPHLMEVLRRHGYTTSLRGDFETGGGLAGLVDAFRIGDRRPSDAALVDQAIRIMERQRDAPFALWLHLDGPHVQTELEPRYRNLFVDNATLPSRFPDLRRAPIWRQKIALLPSERERILADYDRALRQTDDVLRDLLGRAEAAGALAQTLVVITADHGEDLFAHNPYHRGHGVLYDTTTRVPLLWIQPRGSRTTRGSRRIDAPVRGIDLAPTILDLLGIVRSPEFEGDSLLPLVDSGAGLRRFIVARQPCVQGTVYALRTERHKLIFSPTGCQPSYPEGYTYSPSGELFDLVIDPGETKNLASAAPELAAFLKRQLIERESLRHRDRSTPALEQRVRDVMRMAGYVQ